MVNTLSGQMSMRRKKLVFLTGTRADYGKLKSLIAITQKSDLYEVHIFATGMHMKSLYGSTIDEIKKNGFDNIYPFINHDSIDNMDRTLAKTIDGFSHFIAEIEPDLIVVHGDRVEAMAGAIVGSLNNIIVAHIEGGEVSGTIDELIRHAVSKMSHIHLVSNERAKTRLMQLGELSNSIFILGSPDLDLMNPEKLPNLTEVKRYYDIEFDDFSVAMFHPVTTEFKSVQKDVKRFVEEINNDKYNILLGIFIKKSMKHIGNIKIGPINLHHKTAYIGLLIGDNSEWHNGYATESIQAVTKFCFNKLNLMKIVAGCYESNIGSKKAFEKSGYEVEGFLCSHVETDHGREGCWQLGKTA